MLKSIFSILKGPFRGLSSDPRYVITSDRYTFEEKIACLEIYDFEEQLLEPFLAHVPLNAVPGSVFSEILTAGYRRIVNKILATPELTLHGPHVEAYLSEPGLQFEFADDEYRELPKGDDRAMVLIGAPVGIAPDGLVQLARTRELAMCVLARRTAEVLAAEQVSQAVGYITGFSPADVKSFARAPFSYSEDQGRTITDFDLITLRSMMPNEPPKE